MVVLPDWKFWQHKREVRLWQAVMLSLGRDPDALGEDDPALDDYFEDDREASKRLRLLIDNIGNREHFSPGTLNRGDPRLHGIKLPEFAAWAASVVQWPDLPPELAVLAAAPVSPPMPTYHAKPTKAGGGHENGKRWSDE